MYQAVPLGRRATGTLRMQPEPERGLHDPLVLERAAIAADRTMKIGPGRQRPEHRRANPPLQDLSPPLSHFSLCRS